MPKLFRGILIAIILSFSVSISSAQQAQVMEFFHGAECPHCHKEKKFLPTVKKMYPELEIKEYEIWHDEGNKAFADKRLAEFGKKLEGVPTNIIGKNVIVGFQPEAILNSLEETYGAPIIDIEEAESTNTSSDKNSMKKWIFIAILAVVAGGTIYSFSGKNQKK